MTDIIGMILIALGTLVFCIGSIGVFKWTYILNRFHASAINDTLGTLLIIAGLVFLVGFGYHMFKLLLVIVFFYLTSPISGNFIGRVERMTNVHWKEKVGGKK